AEQSSERGDRSNASFAASEPRELGASTAFVATCFSASRDYCDRRTDAADVWRYGVGARPRVARESAGVAIVLVSLRATKPHAEREAYDPAPALSRPRR